MEGMEKLKKLQENDFLFKEEQDEYELDLKTVTGTSEYDYNKVVQAQPMSADQVALERSAYIHERALQMIPISEAINMSSASQMPVTAFKPAKKSYKQRKEDKKQLEILKKRNPEVNEYTLDVYNDIKQRYDAKDNSFEEFQNEQKRKKADGQDVPNVDTAILRSFCRGYKVDKKGRPLTEMDGVYKEKDAEFMSDYCSMDVQRRWKHLDRMLDNILRFEMSEDKASDEYIRLHAGELKDYFDKLSSFEAVMKDEVNKPYFEQLPAWRSALLEAKYSAAYASNFVNVVMSKVRQNAGVNLNGSITIRTNGVLDEKMGAILTQDEQKANKEINDNNAINGAINTLRTGFSAYKWQEIKILDKYTDGELREAVLQKELSKFNHHITVPDYERFMELNEARIQRANSVALRRKGISNLKSNTDTRRILLAFCDGYKTKENSIEPLNEVERQRMENDMELIDDFISNDELRIAKSIEKMIATVISEDIGTEIQNPDYVAANIQKLTAWGSRAMMLQNVKKDRRAKFYFDKVDEETKKMIDDLVMLSFNVNWYVNTYASAHGFSSNKEDLLADRNVESTLKYLDEDYRNKKKEADEAIRKVAADMPQLRRMFLK